MFYKELEIITTKVSKEDFYLGTWAESPTLLKTTLIMNEQKW
jgi:hypothetical protein